MDIKCVWLMQGVTKCSLDGLGYILCPVLLYISINLSQSIELNVTEDEWLVLCKSEKGQLNYFLTVNEEAGESWRYNLRVGTLINNSVMKLANDSLGSLEGVF